MNENIHLSKDNLWQERTPIYYGKKTELKLYSIIRNVYDRFLYPVRNKYLADYLINFVSHGDSLLDIGCAEGTIPYLMSQKKKIAVHGVDVYFKSRPLIPSSRYDGSTLPFENKQFNYSMAVDVLHHCEDIKATLQEMMRVSGGIIIKDHYYKNDWDRFLLKLFDVCANKPYGVNIQFNFKRWEQWEKIFNELDLDYTYLDKQMDCTRLGPIKHFCILLEENGKK
ncbi:MAG: class I SAM-dependent methyltransferase [Thermoplasmata archaeon]|nr:MAG: class I SAM-dependent methyltransferase [Thermoplasmata archaeon]